MTYSHLPTSHNAFRAFESVARLMSFTLAAQELFVTQSAVSRQIKQLEDDLKVSLILRRHRSIELTSQGRELFEVLRQNYLNLDGLIAKWQQPIKPRIVIKAALSYATRVLLPHVSRLNERYPDHEIIIIPSVEEDPNLELEECDLLIINTRKPHLYHGRDDVIFLREEYMAPVYSERVSSTNLSISDLFELPRLHATLDHLDWKTWLKQINLEDHPPQNGRDTVFFSLDLALNACLSGQGVTVTDLLLVLPELSRQFLKTLDEVSVQHSDWQYYCYKGSSSCVTEELLQWIIEETQNDIKQLQLLSQRSGWNHGGIQL